MISTGNERWAMALPPRSSWLLLLCSGLSLGQMIMPSDNTGDLPSAGTGRFSLNSTGNLGASSLRLYPMTSVLEEMSSNAFQDFKINGSLIHVTPNTISDIKSNSIAYIDCDDSAYPGELKASNTFSLASTNDPQPSAIILYSTTSNHCVYMAMEGTEFSKTFTTVDPMPAAVVASRNLTEANSFIFPDIEASKLEVSGNDTSTSSSGSNINGPAPTTATAMIILYAITGIITALFVTIIVTGAIRAHRHPERYGPRNVVGRSRQSRTKGIARAILETLPVVKFGDTDPESGQKKVDVELGAANTSNVVGLRNEAGMADTRGKNRAETASVEGETKSQHSGSAASSRPDGTDEHGSLGCSICTEDFAKGQEVRVLPCNHKFHPDCVDPWLLNVSGTCPLCRVNLDPNSAAETVEPEAGDGRSANHLAPPVDPDAGGSRRPLSVLLMDRLHHRRISTLTSEERLAAARRFNEEGNSAGERPRLSERLRERLHIRTRRQGEDSNTNTPRAVTPVEVSGAISDVGARPRSRPEDASTTRSS